MFHLMLGFMALGMLAAAIAIGLLPLWLGPLVQAIIAAVSKGKIIRWVPGACGILGLLGSLYFFCLKDHVFPWWGVLLYWIVYGLLLWAADVVVCRIKEGLHCRQRG